MNLLSRLRVSRPFHYLPSQPDSIPTDAPTTFRRGHLERQDKIEALDTENCGFEANIPRCILETIQDRATVTIRYNEARALSGNQQRSTEPSQ